MLARRMGWRNPYAPRGTTFQISVGVFADRAIGGEPADVRGIQHAGAPPGVPVVPARGNLALHRGIRVEVRGHHEVVVVGNLVDQFAKALRLVRREHAVGHRVQHLPQHRQASNRLARAGPAPAALHHLLRGQAEDEDVVVTDAFADLDIGSVQRADRQRPVQRQLHVAGAGRLQPGGGDLLRHIGGGNDHLRQADIVVGNEHHLQQPAQRRVVVDHVRHVVDQLDDQLGAAIAGGRLAGEDLHPRHPVRGRPRAHVVVQRDRLQDIEQLALVLVDALDVHVEQRIGIQLDVHPLRHQLRQRLLVGAADAGKLFMDRRVIGSLREIRQCVRIIQHALADDFGEQPGKPRIGSEQPAAERDAVGLVDDAIGIELVQVVEHCLAHQLGVQRGHAVDLVRAEEGERTHAHAPAGTVVDQRDSGERRRIRPRRCADRIQMQPVDLVHDLHMARQQPLHQRHRPALQRLGQQRVIGIGDGGVGDPPRIVPRQFVQIEQDAHQLGDRDRRMRVVQLDRRLVGQQADIAIVLAHVPLTRSCSDADVKKNS